MKRSQGSKRKLDEEEEVKMIEDDEDDDVGVIPDSSDDSDDYEDDQDDDGDESDFDEISADFEINPCVESDYHSIKNMIVKLVPFNETIQFSAGDISDLILEQAKKLKFGRSIRVEGTEDPYGFISVFRFNQIKSNDSIKGLLEFIKMKSKTSESFVDSKIYKSGDQTFINVLMGLSDKSKSNPLGLVFNERFLNVPSELVYPLHQYIQYDIELLSQSDKSFQFQNYIFITTYGVSTKQTQQELDELPPPPTKSSSSSSGGKKMKQTVPQNNNNNNTNSEQDNIPEGTEVFQKVEDKYIRKHSSAWMSWTIPYEYGQGSRWTLSGNLNYKGLIMILPASKMPSLLKDLQEKAIFD